MHLPAHRAYLGLAHVKESTAAPEHDGTALMGYQHVFYAFEDQPPFRVIACGSEFTLPEPRPDRGGERGGADAPPAPRKPTVQFAAGLALDPASAEVIVSYSTLDCGVHLTKVRLSEVLFDIGILW